MKPTYLLTLFITLAQICNAQFSLQGKVVDTSQALILEKASISISRAKDSILIRYSRASSDGSFEIQNLPVGQYLLQITYPGYADFTDILNLTGHTNLGLINMITRAVALENVIVRGSPIRMKGDTLVFMADSFKVREGDNVEALLKRLPGLR